MKYLLGDKVCNHCGGFGVFRAINPYYRIRINFPNESAWEIMDQLYKTRLEVELAAISLKIGDKNVNIEVIAPDGELFDV